MTRLAALVALAGVALIVTGATLLFGAPALIVCGVALVVLGLVPDWEKAT